MLEKKVVTTFSTTLTPVDLAAQCHVCYDKKQFNLCPIRTYLTIDPPFNEFCPIAGKAQCKDVTPEVWEEFFSD